MWQTLTRALRKANQINQYEVFVGTGCIPSVRIPWVALLCYVAFTNAHKATRSNSIKQSSDRVYQ